MPIGIIFGDTPRASVFPRDWGHKQDLNLNGGFKADVWSGAELTIDGGIRRKFQHSQFYDYFPPPGFTFDPNSNKSANYLSTGMTTMSLTPRLDVTPMYFIALCAKRALPERSAALSLFGDREESVYTHYNHEVRKNIDAGHRIAELEAELEHLRGDASASTDTTALRKRAWWRRISSE